MVTLKKVVDTIRSRHSDRGAYDPRHPVPKHALEQILEAARWSPSPHNMQNFEVVAVDDKSVLKRLGKIKSRTSIEFLRENFEQLSFSEEELLEKKIGILASGFPLSWRNPAKLDEVARTSAPAPLRHRVDGSPIVLILIYDPRKRAPASEGDSLGFMGLGCVMENMWLTAQSLGLSFQILSVFGSKPVEKEVKEVLGIPRHLRIAYACRLGYPASKPSKRLRVRRDVQDFAHHNKYGNKGVD